jgi:predicted ester cyclase
MSAEDNKRIVLEFMEAMNRGDIDAAIAPYADEVVNHGMRFNKDRMRMTLEDLQTTFDGVQLETKTVVAEGEWVVLQTVMSGRHAGKNAIPIHMLTPGTEPTGREFSVQVIHMFRVQDGKITEHYAGRDDLGLHWQLGLIPAPDWYKQRMATAKP